MNKQKIQNAVEWFKHFPLDGGEVYGEDEGHAKALVELAQAQGAKCGCI